VSLLISLPRPLRFTALVTSAECGQHATDLVGGAFAMVTAAESVGAVRSGAVDRSAAAWFAGRHRRPGHRFASDLAFH
jgi:hypothetical protein